MPLEVFSCDSARRRLTGRQDRFPNIYVYEKKVWTNKNRTDHCSQLDCAGQDMSMSDECSERAVLRPTERVLRAPDEADQTNRTACRVAVEHFERCHVATAKAGEESR